MELAFCHLLFTLTRCLPLCSPPRARCVDVDPTAKRLYCEEIDVGEEAPRNIASGLVPHYSLGEMKGRRVIVMCNLKVGAGALRYPPFSGAGNTAVL